MSFLTSGAGSDLNVSPSVADVYKNKFLEDWGKIAHLRKPLIAAVSGYAVRPISVSLHML